MSSSVEKYIDAAEEAAALRRRIAGMEARQVVLEAALRHYAEVARDPTIAEEALEYDPCQPVQEGVLCR